MITSAAVWGTGSIGARHLRVLRSLGVMDLTAVPVRSGRSTSPHLADARIAAAIPPNTDLVVIATDTARHVTDAIAALDIGAKVVLVEKPISAALAEIAPLVSHPQRDRIRVCAPLRFTSGLRAARGAIAELPAPVAVRIVAQSWLPDWRPQRNFRDTYSSRPAEGGVLRDLVHEIDYAIWLFGAPLHLDGMVSSTPSPVLDMPVDESADLLWRSVSGAEVSLRIDYVTRPARRSLTVTSAGGAVVWDALTGSVEATNINGSRVLSEYPDDLDPDTALRAQAVALADVILGRHSDVLATLADGLRSVQIGEQVRNRANMWTRK